MATAMAFSNASDGETKTIATFRRATYRTTSPLLGCSDPEVMENNGELT